MKNKLGHTSWKILLVRKDEEQAFLHLSIAQDSVQLLLGFVNTFSVLAVDHENEALCSGIIVPPQRSDLILTSDIPYVELDILIGHRFHVETNWRWERQALVFSRNREDAPVGIVVTD